MERKSGQASPRPSEPAPSKRRESSPGSGLFINAIRFRAGWIRAWRAAVGFESQTRPILLTKPAWRPLVGPHAVGRILFGGLLNACDYSQPSEKSGPATPSASLKPSFPILPFANRRQMESLPNGRTTRERHPRSESGVSDPSRRERSDSCPVSLGMAGPAHQGINCGSDDWWVLVRHISGTRDTSGDSSELVSGRP